MLSPQGEGAIPGERTWGQMKSVNDLHRERGLPLPNGHVEGEAPIDNEEAYNAFLNLVAFFFTLSLVFRADSYVLHMVVWSFLATGMIINWQLRQPLWIILWSVLAIVVMRMPVPGC